MRTDFVKSSLGFLVGLIVPGALVFFAYRYFFRPYLKGTA